MGGGFNYKFHDACLKPRRFIHLTTVGRRIEA